MARMTQAEYLQHQARVLAGRSGTVASVASEGPEADIQDEIEAHLKSLGFRAWYDRKRMDLPTTSRCGVPDFIGWVDGVPFAIEVKRKGKKATPEQAGEIMWAAKAGARTGVAYSLEDAIRILNGTQTKDT